MELVINNNAARFTIASINTTTGEIDVSYSSPVVNYTIFDGKAIVFPNQYFSSPDYIEQVLPDPLANELYYFKLTGTKAKIYRTLADLASETNPIIFTIDALRAKSDIDAGNQGRRVKAPCRAATTANITLSGTQTIDGVALIGGDRVLVKNQTTTSNNGIYEVALGAWPRAYDFSYGIRSIHRPWVATDKNQILSGYLDPLTGLARVVNGRSISIGDDVLLMNQDDPRENDSWRVASGAWSRTRTIFPADYEITRPQFFKVLRGDNIDRWFTINIDSPITIGTTPISIEPTLEPIDRYVDEGTTFILEGSINRQKLFGLTDSNCKVGITPLVFGAYTVGVIPFIFFHLAKKVYTPIPCVELAATDIEDIICCPPAVRTLPPSTATITQGDGSTTIATIAQGFPHVNLVRFRHYGYVNMFVQPNISYRHEVLVENTLPDFTGLGFISYAPPIAGGRNISATFDLKAAPLTFTCVSIYAVGHASYWPPVTVVFSGIMNVPDVRLTMTASKFIKEGDDIAIGDIDVTLTYDAATGYWFGPLENYYNIPGRLHMKLELVKPGETFSKNFTPGAPMIFNASGFNGSSPNKPFFIPITIGLDYESYETPMLLGDVGGVTAGFEGTLYYTTTSFAIKYSTYNSARKPKNYFYQYAFFPYESGNFYTDKYQTSDFFNSNNYWLSSVNATMEFITTPTPPPS